MSEIIDGVIILLVGLSSVTSITIGIKILLYPKNLYKRNRSYLKNKMSENEYADFAAMNYGKNNISISKDRKWKLKPLLTDQAIKNF